MSATPTVQPSATREALPTPSPGESDQIAHHGTGLLSMMRKTALLSMLATCGAVDADFRMVPRDFHAIGGTSNHYLTQRTAKGFHLLGDLGAYFGLWRRCSPLVRTSTRCWAASDRPTSSRISRAATLVTSRFPRATRRLCFQRTLTFGRIRRGIFYALLDVGTFELL